MLPLPHELLQATMLATDCRKKAKL